MSSVESSHINDNNNGFRNRRSMKLILAVLGIGTLFTITILAVSIAILVKVNNGSGNDDNQPTTSSLPTTTTSNSLNSILADSIRIADLMVHLNALQKIANDSANTRAIGTPGFSETINYIQKVLTDNAPTLSVFRQPFPVQNFSIDGSPILISSINGVNKTFFYSDNLARSEFTYVNYSTSISLTEFNLIVIPNNGCNDSDWQNVAGRAALVIAGGTCTFAEKGELANKFNASALLYYNNGATTTNLAPTIARLRQANKLPALYLSFAVGQELVNAANTTNVIVHLEIKLKNLPPFNVDNICADTNDGNSSETIVVGSHSDSVPAGPGINDNGSGTAANLVLAINLARLYQSGNYPKYKYRVRFCWWGAEEIGLVGSISHVQQAQNPSTTPGNRLQDYLINLNYDMLGSPNYMFGIYDGRTAKPGTAPEAIDGSIKISEEFLSWFNRQNLPSDYTDFSGRSDYGPFLAAGIVAGGLFSGADETKSMEQRTRYEMKLGNGRGGLAGAILDPCYHKSCDTVDNIDQFGYEKMVQAAAYMLEFLGKQENLLGWLYPKGRPRARLSDNYFPNSDYFRETNV